MNNSEKNYYNQGYYESYKSQSGLEYEHGKGWEEIFGNLAERIVREINPKKTLDVGCAIGFLVESFRDKGVEAYGIDISEYAISEVREDIKPYCKVQSALLPIGKKYDLITCIEVLEHLDGNDIPAAIRNMCEASDDIIFSSTPFEYDEESHISVHTPGWWAEQFAYNGFYHDVQYDCSYISVQAMRFRKGDKSKIDLIRDYEGELFQKHQELVAARRRYTLSEENVRIYKDAYQKHVDMINEELNPKINELNEKLKKTEASQSEQAYKEEIERRCQLRLEEEIKKRKNLEEKYYENEDALEIMECCQTELNQAITTINLLQQQLAGKNKGGLTLWGTVKEYLAYKRLEKSLLHKDTLYWKPVFDARCYAEYNPDVYEAYGMDEKALLKHFICYGMYEGRRASKEFDIDVYMRCNPDVVEARRFDKRACYLHYITDGMSEGRRAI